MDLVGGVDDPLGDDVAAHDAAEDIDEDPLDIRVLEDDLEGFGDLFAAGAAANIEEVGRLAATFMEDVEGGHGQAGAVDQTTDAAVELDVGEVVFAGGDFEGVELRVVDHVGVLAMAEDGVVVEGDLGVHGHEPAGLGHHQRVDLDQGAVLLQAGAVEAEDELDAILAQAPLEAEGERDLARLVGVEPGQRVDGELVDLLRRFARHLLDLDPAFGRGDEDVARRGAVEGDGEIELASDLHRLFDQDAPHPQSFRSGLRRHQLAREEILGQLLRLLRVMHHLDAAGLAAAAGVDLCLDHAMSAHHLGGALDLVGGETDAAARDRDVIGTENLFGLVLVNVHGHLREWTCQTRRGQV